MCRIAECCASCQFWVRSYSNRKMCRYGDCRTEDGKQTIEQTYDYEVCNGYRCTADQRRIKHPIDKS